MALRNLVIEGDPLLRKKSRPVDEINPRIIKLLDDMADWQRRLPLRSRQDL